MANTSKTTPPLAPPTLSEVMRYRYHYGANLGSVFVLEGWLTPSMSPPNTKGQSELSSVEGWIKAEGIAKTKERFAKHWKEFVSDADLDWLSGVSANCTTLRLPVGYFTLGPDFCRRTPFESVARVYQNAWAAVLALIGKCQQRGIGVLIDLHALPGGANPDSHSGTDSGKAEFWTSRRYRELATACLSFIAQQVKGVEGVVGIQVVNEATHNAPNMYEWYDSVLDELSKNDPSMPVYVSDGWDLHRATDWARHKNSTRARYANPVVVDTHCYWCFSDQDKQKTPQQIIDEVPSKLSELTGKSGNVFDHGASQVIIGEYSCVLDEQTWAKSGGVPKNNLVHDFGNAECSRYLTQAGGAFFWTYRMDWMDGGEWGFRQMTTDRAIVPPTYMTWSAHDIEGKVQVAKAQQSDRQHNASAQHSKYWDTNHPGHYEHWRFEAGWEVGYGDAMAFFEMRARHGHSTGADMIGMLDLWCLKRLRESGQSGGFGWEFEHGLRTGVAELYDAVGLCK